VLTPHLATSPQHGRGSNDEAAVVVAVELGDPPEVVDVDPVVGGVVDGAPEVTGSGLPYWSSGGVVADPGAAPRNAAIVWLAVGSCTISTSSLPYGA
jgi:uncharacterized Zn-binding protein involved in type VI secretion